MLRCWGFGFGLLFILAGCTSYINNVPAKIPSQFHGQWVVDLATCNIEGFGNDGDIYISATTVAFHAEPYRVKTLRKDGRTFIVTYDPPEEQYMVPPAILSLSTDSKTLSDLWSRCPKAAKRLKAR
jgi:hypothetical protein